VSHSKSESTIQATICLPENSRMGDHVIHPSLLDACFQLLITTLDDTVAVGDAFLPVKIQSLMVSTLPASDATYRVIVTRYAAPSDDDLIGDIQMQNDQGQVVLAVERLEMKRLARNARKLDDLLYSIQWKDSPGLPTPGQAEGRWLIATDDQDAAEILAASLRLLGAVCDIKLLADQALDRGLDDLRQDILRSLIEPYRDVVFLATCQSAPGPSVAEKYILRLLALVQVIAQADWQEPPRLRVVTVGAQAILKGDIVSPALTALWGMAASIAHEFPEWRCSLVDLDSLVDGSVLSRELLIDDQDPVGFGPVAWRGEQRYIAELIQHSPSNDRRSQIELATPANGRPFRVVSTQPGVLETLALRAVQRPEPGSGQVEIAVFTTGLNFMNVLSALGTYPGYPAGSGPLGIECSGIVSRIGPDVNGLRKGDAVMAVAFHSLGTHAIAEASLVQLKPASMSFEQAATIPITFLTAYYSLCHLGHMKHGERVLIHSAAGGVGLAAVQLANHFGAEIFATAGNEEKRAYLHSLGIAHVMDSRTLDFADQIMTITDGQGVDLVLNSLSGEAIPRSLASLAPYGRFLEIGKRDIYENTQVGLLPFQKNLSYSAIDLDRMARERPELLGQLFTEVMELFRQGNIAPLPLSVFPVAQTVDAFHTMAQATHIGKIVISLEDKTDLNLLPSLQDTARIKSDGTYLITGGLGALGLKVAGWLAEQGAQHIVLVGRSGLANLTPEAASTINALEEQGVNLVVESVDIADFNQVHLLIQSIQENLSPLRGIIHAAGVLDDGVLTSQTEDRFYKVLAPKIYGAWNLHQLTLSHSLDFFILFSSVTAAFGSPGQANYAAANAFLDGLAHFRHASGLAALSINWGPWSQIGLAAQRQQGGLQGLAGLSAITPDDGLRILGKLMDGDAAQVIATNLDAVEWQVHHPAAKTSSLFAGLASQPDIQAVRTSTKGILANLLATEAGRSRRALLENFVQEQVAHVLRLPPERVDFHKPLRAMGMDSLMTIEFRNRLEGNLGLTLSASLVWNYPTINDIVPYLAEKAGIPLEMTPATSGSKTSAGPLSEEAVSAALKSLSDDEVSDLLDDELSAIDDLLKKKNP
jgi:NADPH:quinone reductase-like Zn-dependent oxidoreductase/acyl carrier protein